VEPDPPNAVWTQVDTLPYGVGNIDAEVVWGGTQGATNVVAGQGGFGVKVAVIDTGIDCGHLDLLPGCFYGANFVSSLLAFDDNGHGTHVAGIIGARDNGQGAIGVAPEVELYAVKVLDSAGSGSWSAVAAGINWAVANNMNVINMSIGGTTGSQAIADAVAAAAAAGVLVVSAAGNSGCCNTVLYPAKYTGSMAIAAVDQADNWVSFSSTGAEVDVAAPGATIWSTVPTGVCSLCDPSGYKYLSGTSMATPHVSGVGALLMSRGRSRSEAWSLITGTARDLGSAGFDSYFGWGRVNALAAVGGAPSSPPSSPPSGDIVAPMTSITTPPNGATVARRSLVAIQATASDNVGVARVEFYVEGTLKCSDSAAPYTCSWKVPASPGKSYALQSIAYDPTGNLGQSAVIRVSTR
jgi:subtilisin family serine protease